MDSLKQLTVLGAGLLGASVMQAAKKKGVARKCVTWSRSEETRELCRRADYIDGVFDSPEDAARNADCVVICIPVNRIVPLAMRIVPALSPDALLTDVGSTKASICAEADAALPAGVRFVGSHPMAGSELNGFLAARADLLENRLCFVADDDRSRRTGALGQAEAFWSALGMRTHRIAPEEHDNVVAHVSHLPHSVAVALAATLAGKPEAWKQYGAGGMRDTTRVSAGDPYVWRAILEENREKILPALAAFQTQFSALRQALEKEDSAALLDLLAAAAAWRAPLSR